LTTLDPVANERAQRIPAARVGLLAQARLTKRRAAGVLFVSGWSLFWASALGLTPLLPLWLPLCALTAGLTILLATR
jgi:hypothetical protein